MGNYLRLRDLGLGGEITLLEQLTWKRMPDWREHKEVLRLLKECESVPGYDRFDVILRLPAFEICDRLQNQPPALMRGSLSWMATRTYAGTVDLDGSRSGYGELCRLLKHAARDLRDPSTKPLDVGSDPVPYPTPHTT